MDFSKVLSGYERYVKPPVTLEYGTAGFRTRATLLDHVAFRVGIVACLRSMQKNKVIGLMITASHNPEADNGVKVIDPDGGMLEYRWEEIATHVVNSDNDQIEDILNSVIKTNAIDIQNQGTVILGWDTRTSSENLVEIACVGISSVKGNPIKICLCTTPALHYLVRCHNDSSYGTASIDGYYNKILSAFHKLWKGNNKNGNYIPELYFDGANGVGALTMKCVDEKINDKIKVNIFNDATKIPSKLNFQCGADYVKQFQKFPDELPAIPHARYVSFDGDADRIVYYYLDEKNNFHLMDGDRMATLMAVFLKNVIDKAALNVSFGIVQTAYANGSSTKYINRELKIEVSCVKTGVKYLHHEALKYDVGIYFEANGHGTVVFSQNLKNLLTESISTASGPRLEALNILKLFIDIVNETIGDALSDLLAVETILHAKGWSLKDWEMLYDVLPYQMLKVTIKNRNVITTTDAERKCLTPVGLQDEIDNLVAQYESARSFVRPSGTEDIVRIYSEAASQAEADELALKVAQKVYDLAVGVGDRPQ